MLNFFYDFGKCESFQLNFGDYLLIFDGKNLQSQLILKLDYSHTHTKKIISSTGKYLTVQFLTNDDETNWGFKSFFNYIPINPYCSNWLNMATKLLESPDYPTIDCSWVITAPFIDSLIVIQFDFETFEVKLCSMIESF